jgi:uncharacterized protein
MPTVTRPVVRSFRSPFEANCAAWVNAGGHGILWSAPPGTRGVRASLVQPIPDESNPSDLSLFSMLDCGEDTWVEPKSGPFKGLAVVEVPRDAHWILQRRAERDSAFPKPKRRVSMDCLACGTCCTDNDVLLEEGDIKRFEKAKRADLLKPPFARRKDGKLRLTLLPNKRCHHLAKDNRCDIYKIRPDSCSHFPVASECCLYARESEKGFFDGVEPESNNPQ